MMYAFLCCLEILQCLLAKLDLFFCNCSMLLFDDGRCLKICDFGTAKLLDATSADTFIGTPYYLAPEVIEGMMLLLLLLLGK